MAEELRVAKGLGIPMIGWQPTTVDAMIL